MQKILFYSLVGLLCFAGIACNLLTAEESSFEYPTAYPVIDFSDLNQMNEDYQAANNNHICSTLNKYGFTGFSDILFENGKNPCDRANREVVRIEMTNPDTLLESAKLALLRNSVYTGVSDTSALQLKEMLPQPGCIKCGRPDEYSANIEWKLTFEDQLIDTIEVPETEIIVFMDALGVNRIWGNWYPDVQVPQFINYGYLEVQEGMVGWQIDMRPYTGESEIYTVRTEDLIERPQKVLLPIENEANNLLEMRYCWSIPVDYQGDSFNGWIAYIDIEEGLLIDLKSR